MLPLSLFPCRFDPIKMPEKRSVPARAERRRTRTGPSTNGATLLRERLAPPPVDGRAPRGGADYSPLTDVTDGVALLPVSFAQKPTVWEPPAGIEAFQLSGVTV